MVHTHQYSSIFSPFAQTRLTSTKDCSGHADYATASAAVLLEIRTPTDTAIHAIQKKAREGD
jgi:hypothetical protein